MNTPRETSPYTLIQEELRDEPWKLLVAVILLNQTSAKQARPVWEEFFGKYSTPDILLSSGDFSADGDIVSLFRPLGFQNRRAERILLMTLDFTVWNGSDPLDLYGIGKYGADSYNMFVKGVIVEDVEDKELRNYVRWAKEQHGNT